MILTHDTPLDARELRRKQAGKRFGEICAMAGYRTQHDIAEATGFSRIQVQRWVTGVNRPKEDNVETLWSVLRPSVPNEITEEDFYLLFDYLPPEKADETNLRLVHRLGSILRRAPREKRHVIEALLERDAENYVALVSSPG